MKNKQSLGCAVIVRHATTGNILLGKRKNAYKEGSYGMPGGHLELGEPLQDCALRELAEETNIKTSEFEFVGTVRENQGEYDFIHFIFLIETNQLEVEVREPDKCESWQWFPVDELPENILPGHAAGIELMTNDEVLADLFEA